MKLLFLWLWDSLRVERCAFSNGGGSGCVRKHEGALVMTCAGYFYAAMTKYQRNNLAKEGVVPAHCFRVQVVVSWPCEAEHSITVVGEDRRRQLFLGGQKESKEAYRK